MMGDRVRGLRAADGGALSPSSSGTRATRSQENNVHAPEQLSDLHDRVAAVEARLGDIVELLKENGARNPAGASSLRDHPPVARPHAETAFATAPDEPDDNDPFWALNALKRRYPAPGAVSFTGSVDLGTGHVEYQWDRPTSAILDADWAERSERAAALGHPLRLALLRLLLDAHRTVAQLVDELDLASTGVAYHHLNQLQSAGWVTSPRRGVWAVPGSRIVPLLSILIALEES